MVACSVSKGSLPEGTIGKNGSDFFLGGDLYVRGYSEVIPVQEEPFCEKNCIMRDYVFFKVLKAGHVFNTSAFGDENSYVSSESIGLGCTLNSMMSYFNVSDETGMKEYHLSSQLSEKILNSTPNKLVSLHLTKKPFSGGSEGPGCYAHFTKIEEYK